MVLPTLVSIMLTQLSELGDHFQVFVGLLLVFMKTLEDD